MKFGQNVPGCKIILEKPKNADVGKISAKKLRILYIKLGLCDCKERENTKNFLI